ncbi:HAD-IA family hydrolase [Lysobacter claricitrinus]|uniref:HAD-IA family hydrolase n=1 Tax=Lysobacter claricitrinus TaxID=3367728 RepID=UPI0037DB956E
MIRAVLFDFDGVLTTHPSGSFTTVASLSAALALPAAEIWAAFAPFNDDLLYGRATHASVWPAVCERLGRDVDIRLLIDAFDSTPINAPMFALARELAAHVAVGIVTDNKQDRIDHLSRRWALRALFDPIVVSAAVGSGKRGPAIFEHALHALDASAAEVVFIDNSPCNLVAPAALGIHAMHFDDAANDVGALAAALHARFGLGVRDVEKNAPRVV